MADHAVEGRRDQVGRRDLVGPRSRSGGAEVEIWVFGMEVSRGFALGARVLSRMGKPAVGSFNVLACCVLDPQQIDRVTYSLAVTQVPAVFVGDKRRTRRSCAVVAAGRKSLTTHARFTH